MNLAGAGSAGVNLESNNVDNMEIKNEVKGWYQLNFEYDARDKVGFTMNKVFLGKKLNGYLKIFWPKEKNRKGYIFYFALEGTDYYKKLISLFPSLSPAEAPVKTDITRFAGATIERDWMFK